MKKFFSINNKSFIFVFRILIGCVIVWYSLYYLNDNHKIWAIISVIVVTDPDIDSLRSATISRIINTITGCGLALLFMSIFKANFFSLLIAITISVIISTSFKKYPASWKLAPTTVAIVMIPSIVEGVPWNLSMLVALQRTAEILFGTLVAYGLGRLISAIKFKYFSKPEAHQENIKIPAENI